MRDMEQVAPESVILFSWDAWTFLAKAQKIHGARTLDQALYHSGPRPRQDRRTRTAYDHQLMSGLPERKSPSLSLEQSTLANDLGVAQAIETAYEHLRYP